MSTKILATIGPSSLYESVIVELEQKGIDLFRINLSHTKIEDLRGVIEKIHSWSSVPVCLDSEGAQVRNQDMISEAVTFRKGDKVKIHKSYIKGDAENISLTPGNVYEQLVAGDVIYIDFNSVTLKVTELGGSTHIAEVINSGKVGSNKAVNIDRDIVLSPITEKDIRAFELGKSMGIDNFSLSFTNSADDVISAPNFKKIASTFSFDYIRCRSSKTLDESLDKLLSSNKSTILEIYGRHDQEYVEISHTKNLDGKFVRRPLEDQWPFIDRDVFLKEMIIDPIDQ